MNMKRSLFILFIFLIFPVFSEEINLSYPNNVLVGREFNLSVTLINFSLDFYDVKIDIVNKTINGTSNIAQRFWNNTWKSTFYWISDAINLSEKNNEIFRLNITENYYGLNNITVKIRSSRNNIKNFTYLINISYSEFNSSNYSNFSSNNSSNSSSASNSEIYYRLNFDEEVNNGEEFYVDIEIFNLDNKEYDVKLWIENNSKIISERYDENNDEWKSGNYYVNNFFKGAGNKTGKIKIRIDKDYKEFSGESNLFFKIRNGLKINYTIDIIKKENKTEIENKNEKKENKDKLKIEEVKKPITASVIRLNSVNNKINSTESIKTDNYTVYESKTEKIKKHSVYGFAILSVILCILISWNKL